MAEKKIPLAITTDVFGQSSRMEDMDALLKRISDAGFTHIHWCHEWDGDYIYSVYEMEQLKELLDKYHLSVKGIHSTRGSSHNPNHFSGHYRKDYTSDWEYNRKAGVELLKNRVDMAKALGTTEIVLHLYVPYQTIGDDKAKMDKFYEAVYRSFDELEPYCLQKKVRICVENLFDPPAEVQLDQFRRIFPRYSPEFLGLCLDSGHANMSFGMGMIDIMEEYKDRLYAVHLHDNFGDGDAHAIPGNGNIDWKRVMTALKKSAYTLPITMELNCNMEDKDQFLKDAIKSGEWLTKLYEEA